MPDYGLSEYKRIMTEILPLMKNWLPTIPSITSAQDPRWKQLVEEFEKIEAAAPPDLKRYAGAMVAMHVDELERRWRK